MIREKDFEDIICKYPELIEDGLTFKGRQVTLFGRRMDVLFEDRFRRRLIIELKSGPIKDEHIGQILSYEGILLSGEDPTIRVMLVGNRVPPNIKRSLDHHGIAWKEITLTTLKEFLESKRDVAFLSLFEDVAPVAEQRKTNSVRKIVKEDSEPPTLINYPRLYTDIKKRLLEMQVQNHSKYTIEQILEKQKIGDLVGNLILTFHEELIKRLSQNNLFWITRTHSNGLSYLCTGIKAFMFVDLFPRYLSIKFFTGTSKIDGLGKGIWLNKEDNLGSERYRVIDDSTLRRAVDFALKSYKIALAWSK